MKLPAVVLAAGLLLALLALGLAVRSKALLKDALDVDCADRALDVVVHVRTGLEERLAAVRAGERPDAVAARWWLDHQGRVLAREPARAPEPDSRLLPPNAGAPGATGWQPVMVRGQGEPLAAHWLEARDPGAPAGARGLLVGWDLEAVRALVIQPALGGDARYALHLLHDTDTAASAGVPFRPKAVLALDPPLAFWRVAVGLADPDAARSSLRLQTGIMVALALCLLLVLAGGVLLSWRRDRLEAARRREREELLARATHELQTPLALLRAAAESLDRGAVSDPAEVQRCLSIVAREEERLTARVRRLLRHLRREVEGDEAPGDLREAALEASRELEPSLLAAGVTLEVEDALGPGWLGPRELLGDAVRELLGNVARHARGATRARVRLGAGPRGARIEVEDDGPGLPPGTRAGAAGPGEPDARGGLGLLLVRQGLQRAGGALAAEAGGQGGLAVRLEVPCRRA